MRGRLIGSPVSTDGAAQGLELVRIVTALLILIHGVYRALAGGVAPFGEWLDGLGFPMGIAWATAVTALEWVGPGLILARRWVFWACLAHMGVLALGLVLVHLPSGWFVVGAGRNGVEYSVLILTCLAATAWAYRPNRT
jgi:putative oxidoreductase